MRLQKKNYINKIKSIKKQLNKKQNIFHREWLTPNALQQSITGVIHERDSDTSPL